MGKVQVSLEEEKAWVEYDPRLVSPEEMKRAVEGMDWKRGVPGLARSRVEVLETTSSEN